MRALMYVLNKTVVIILDNFLSKFQMYENLIITVVERYCHR